MRENGCLNYEKPFLYLFFGSEKALLIDTGARQTHVASAVSGVIDEWAARNHRKPLLLIVGHSHSHDDHIAGDAQFRARPNTTVVPLTIEATMKSFDIPRWPDGFGKIDLGGRILDVFPIPGHDVLSLAYYDRQTGILDAGDRLYPGRLYVHEDAPFA